MNVNQEAIVFGFKEMGIVIVSATVFFFGTFWLHKKIDIRQKTGLGEVTRFYQYKIDALESRELVIEKTSSCEDEEIFLDQYTTPVETASADKAAPPVKKMVVHIYARTEKGRKCDSFKRYPISQKFVISYAMPSEVMISCQDRLTVTSPTSSHK